MTLGKRALFYSIYFFIVALFFLISAEIFLRFLPVSTGLKFQEVNAESPVFRATPNRAYSHSRQWDFKNPNSGRVNNDGFVNDQNYIRDSKIPLISVIGDSYIEALMVPYNDTIQGRLAYTLKNRTRVYSYAFSGAPLSQYLIWADYARKTYSPKTYIFNIIGNDFDESLAKYKQSRGFYQYHEETDGLLKLKLTPLKFSFLAKVGRHSLLARYLRDHLHVMRSLPKLQNLFFNKSGNTPKIQYVANTLSDTRDERVLDSLIVIDAFFRDLPHHTGVSPKNVLFTIDGLRNAIYNPQNKEISNKSYFALMRKTFILKARSLGYNVIDLQTVFEKEYSLNQRKFESLHDWHWDSYGHGVAATAIQKSDWFKSIASDPPVLE